MVIRGEGIGPRVKYWVKPDIENRIKEGSIKAYTHSSLTAIRPGEVDIITPDGPITIPNDYVIALDTVSGRWSAKLPIDSDCASF